MVTTIQLSNKTKSKLDQIKKDKKISYDKIVSNLLKHEDKMILKEEIANYYSKYANEDLEEVNEWIHTEVNE